MKSTDAARRLDEPGAVTDVDTALIRSVGAGRTYGSGRAAVVAVYGATCAVHAADRIAIVGPSGSGKSTLLHLLTGLERPSVGTVDWPAIEGRASDPAALGLVFQAPSLIPSLTVEENVVLPLLMSPGADRAAGEPTASRERARDALAVLGLGDLAGSLPQELSGGQAQRAVIARVLASRPRVVLADEPTSQLDRDTADHVARVLVDVCDEIGAALVVATHDDAVARRLSTTWQIVDGRLHPDATGGGS